MSEQKPSLAGAIALIVIGLVVLVPSGLCTGAVGLLPLIQAIQNPRYGAAAFGSLPIALIFGGPFILGGGAMVWRGIARLRAARGMEKRD